jgi:uncharacterized protein YbjT (DUF2867 family)
LSTHAPTIRAFVAGSTGYTGQHLVALLASDAAHTTAHIRPDSSSLQRYSETFEALGAHIDTSPWQLDALTQRFKDLQPTHIFALLGTTQKRIKQLKRAGLDHTSATYDAVDHKLTVMLLDAALQAGITPRFIYLSSAGAQSTPGPYMQARRDVEAKLAQTPSIPSVIARPGFISGPDRDDDRPLERFGSSLTHLLCSPLDLLGAQSTADHIRPISGLQLAAALLAIAKDPSISSPVEPHQLHTIARAVMQRGGL